MPSRFAFRGERLAFSAGIVALAVARDRRPGRVRRPGRGADPALRDRRVHLDHAVAGRDGPPLAARARRRLAAERARSTAFGAVATGIVTIVFAIAKFALGAWLIIVIIPVLVAAMLFDPPPVRAAPARDRGPPGGRHRAAAAPPAGASSRSPDVTRDVVQAVKFGRTMSDDVTAVHVTDDLGARRARSASASSGSCPGCPLVIVESPYPLSSSGRSSATSRTPPARPATTSSSSCCPSTCRATGGSASSTTRTPGGSGERCSAGRTSSSPDVAVSARGRLTESTRRRERLGPVTATPSADAAR